MTPLAALARGWSAPTSPRAAYALAAALGLASILLVHGPGFVVGTSSYWDMPSLDHRSYLSGYRYFLHEPWRWPLFEAHGINAPYTQSIAFNDSLPLWALLNKALATIIPPWGDFSLRAYLGLWYALATALQAAFGVAVLRALGHRSRGATVVGALFFLAIPPWTFRYPHASLYGHFLILWALYLYLVLPDPRRPRAAAAAAADDANAARARRVRRVRIGQLAQLAAASLLNPYHAVMSLAVLAASLARAPSWRARAAWLLGALAAVAAALALAGYFGGASVYAEANFHLAGSNLLGPVMPRRSGWLGEALWRDPTGLQFDGLCYLGLGVIALAALAASRPRELWAAARRHAALAAVTGAVALFALSNHVYLGSHRVLAYRIPRLLHWLPDQFRGPGRLSWLPVYVVVIFVLSRALSAARPRWQRALLPALAVVQLVDVVPDWRAYREVTRGPAPAVLDAAAWRALLAQSDAVQVAPAHACNNDASFEPATHIQYLAAERGVPINGIYSSRTARDCVADDVALRDLHAAPRTLYVFVSPMTALARRLAAGGLPCAHFGFGEVCHPDPAVIRPLLAAGAGPGSGRGSGPGFTPTPPPAPLAFGAPVALTDPVATYLELGWRWATPQGRWTYGPAARLSFAPAGPPPPAPVLRVAASAYLCFNRPWQTVDVLVSGAPVGALRFDLASNAPGAERQLPIPPALLARPVVDVELRPRDTRTPADLRCSRDPTPLGLLVERLSIGPAAAAPAGPAP